MDNIELRSDLHAALEKDAEQEAKSVNDLVNEAVEYYLRERQRAKLDQEIAAFETMHPDLHQKHLGQWVAIHNKKLIDFYEDGSALYQRVRTRYGKTSILIRQVTEKPVEDVWVKTPSTGKLA